MLQDVISILGIANPQLSFTWQDDGDPIADQALPLILSSNAAEGEWKAPAAGLFNKLYAERLSLGDGSSPAEGTWVIKLQPQVYARITRLYSRILEGKTVKTQFPQRPVPMYFAYHNTTAGTTEPLTGNYDPGSSLNIKGGTLSIHDQAGQPIDPLAVASAWLAIATNFPAIVAKSFTGTSSAPPLTATQLSSLITGISNKTILRCTTMFRTPQKSAADKFNNISVVDADAGLYELTNPAQAVSVTSPADGNEKWALGSCTTGTVSDAFTIQALATGVEMKRDYFNLFADDINVHIKGTLQEDAPFDGEDFKVAVLHNEQIDLLPNGSVVLARAEQTIRTAANLSLAVAPVINDNFAVAQDPVNAEWPAFPPGGDGVIPGRLKDLILSAHFLKSPLDQRDVYIQMQVPETTPGTPQLSSGTALRLYNRKFLADAREGRGNGAGAVLNDDFTAGFVLTNPLGLRENEALPAGPNLLFDMIAVNRTGSKRSFGLLHTKVDPPADLNAAELVLANRGNNAFNTATERSIAPSGLLGLSTQSLNTLPSVTDLNSSVEAALTLGNESQPRIAPRLPIMTRNENIAAGRNAAGSWTAVLSGLWLRSDSSSSFHRIGGPGSTGGEEFLGVGISTSGGILAYRLARAALRRTKGLASRLEILEADSRWAVPTATPSGNFSAAILQDIAPGADSANLKLVPETVLEQLPSDWNGVVNNVANIIPAGLASNSAVKNAISSLAGSTKGAFLYQEFKKELLTAKYGRRESLPALKSAISAARDLIYIETGALAFTDYVANDNTDPENKNDPPDTDTDLVSLLAKMLNEKKGLHIIIAVSKEISVGAGYESFAARAYDRRIRAFNTLKDGTDGRVVIFHPIGFPGRPIRLMHTLVIIDDIWMFAGSGTFNRRGVMFDGNLSLVCVDREIEEGKSKAINRFRRKIMENHLGVKPLPGTPAQTFLHPNEARLADLHETFYAVAEMLAQGGAGLIAPLFDGKITGTEPIPESSYPHRDLADPDGLIYPDTLGALLQAFAGLGDADA